MRISNKILKKTIAIIVFVAVLWFMLPLNLFRKSYSIVIQSNKGNLLGASIAKDEQWRFPPSDQIPEKFLTSIICFEDKRFYKHWGIDFLALMRAVKSNLENRRVVSGASTITMQTIRLSRSPRPRNVGEKIIEAFLSLKLELKQSKKEIISLYVNNAPFGGNVVGLPAASWRYFGRDMETLSWAESAMLAVLPNSPSLIHPAKNRKELKQKRDRLLKDLCHNKKIDSTTAYLSMMEPLPPKPFSIPSVTPHLLFRVKKENKKIDRIIETTISYDLQKRVNKISEKHHGVLKGNSINNLATLIIDIHKNEVITYVGNSGIENLVQNNSFVDIITAPRSSGSILKPFLYAGLLSSGEILPDQLIYDIPTRMGGFAPQNYSKSFDGAVPVSSALARSLNIPAVRMLHTYGVNRFYMLLKDFGISTLHRSAEDYGLSLILGGAEVTLWDVTSAYAGMVRHLNNYYEQGNNISFTYPTIYKSFKNIKNGFKDTPITKGSSYLTFEALLKVARPGEEQSWQSFASSKKIAWKTGTSYGFRDGWAVGVNKNFAVGVWVGNGTGEGRPGLTGIETAAPILFEIFSLLNTGDWFEKPEMDLREIEVCRHSGFRKSKYCDEAKVSSVPKESIEKALSCSYCQPVHLDDKEEWQVNSNCEDIDKIKTVNRFILPSAVEWYYARSHSDYKKLPPLRRDCEFNTFSDNKYDISFIYPEENAKVYIPLELMGSRGRLVVKAANRFKEKNIFWYLDDEYIGATNTMHHKEIMASTGKHTITIVSEKGEIVNRTFTILRKG